MIEFFSGEIRQPDQELLNMLATIGSQIGQFIERKRAEEALRASEERFRTLVQFSFDVYWESDAQHRFTRQEFAEGLADAPVPGSDIGIGKTRWELPHLEPEEEAWRKHRETLDAHLPFRDFELARPQPDGGKRYWSVSGLPVFDETGRFVGYRGLGRQITERKRMEEALRKQEKELREVVETIPAMTVTVLPDGTNVFIGKRFAEYSGLSPEDAQGSGWKACVHPDDLDLHVRKWRASLASGEPIELEARFRRADGQYRWFLARAVPLRDEAGNILNWYEVLTDIEDRKRAEEALRESAEALRRSEAHLAEAQRLSHTGSSVYNETTVLYWSEECYRIWNFDPLRGPPTREAVSQRIHPDDRARVRAEAQRALGQKRGYSIEFRILLPDGTIKHLEVSGHPVFSASGELVEIISTHVDVTERKRAEEALRESEAKIRRLVDANIIGIFIWDFDGRIIEANDAFLRMVDYDREDLVSGRMRWTDLTPPEWRDRDERRLRELKVTGSLQPFEKEYFGKDGSC